MKTVYRISIFALLCIFTINIAYSKDYRTKSGFNWNEDISNPNSWTEDTIWEEETGGQGWIDYAEYPEIEGANNDKIHIGWDSITGHHVILNDTLDVSNNVTIKIYSGNSLVIDGDLVVHNSFEVIVDDNAKFKVNGKISINANNDNQQAELKIDGEAEVVGSIDGYGEVSGTGSLDVDGEVGEDININPGDDDSVNVTSSAETYHPPQNFQAEVEPNGESYNVTLKWELEDEYEPTGFQLKRDGDVIFEDSIGTSKNTLSYTSYSYTDEDLDGYAEPVYEVRAAYGSNGSTIYSTAEEISFVDNPLPIELIHFNVNAKNDNVLIEWATATEIINDFFTIERSVDLRNWEIIGYVDGAGDSNSMLSYQFEDNNPITGTSYYRLKQTDYDGQFEYFDPVAVQFVDDVADMKILNVSSNGGNNMNIVVNNQDYNAELVVADIQGRIVYTRSVDVSDFAQEINVNFTKNYSGEILLIRLYSNNNSDGKKVMIN